MWFASDLVLRVATASLLSVFDAGMMVLGLGSLLVQIKQLKQLQPDKNKQFSVKCLLFPVGKKDSIEFVKWKECII